MPATSGKLTPKQARFVAEYLVDLNGTQAAIRAGYAPKTANRTASDLLSKSDISALISERKAKQLEKADLTATRVLEEIRRLSFADLRTLFDEQGNLRPIHELTAEQAACIASLEVVKRNLTAGDGHTDTVIKLKVWDKTRSLEMLAKHFGLLVEKVEHSGNLLIAHELPEPSR